MTETETDEKLYMLAVDLLEAVWRSLDHASMNSSRRLRIWDEFGNRIRASSHAESLAAFVETLARKLGVTELRAQAPQTLKKIEADEAGNVLALIRREPLLLTAELRVRREEKREEWTDDNA